MNPNIKLDRDLTWALREEGPTLTIRPDISYILSQVVDCELQDSFTPQSELEEFGLDILHEILKSGQEVKRSLTEAIPQYFVRSAEEEPSTIGPLSKGLRCALLAAYKVGRIQEQHVKSGSYRFARGPIQLRGYETTEDMLFGKYIREEKLNFRNWDGDLSNFKEWLQKSQDTLCTQMQPTPQYLYLINKSKINRAGDPVETSDPGIKALARIPVGLYKFEADIVTRMDIASARLLRAIDPTQLVFLQRRDRQQRWCYSEYLPFELSTPEITLQSKLSAMSHYLKFVQSLAHKGIFLTDQVPENLRFRDSNELVLIDAHSIIDKDDQFFTPILINELYVNRDIIIGGFEKLLEDPEQLLLHQSVILILSMIFDQGHLDDSLKRYGTEVRESLLFLKYTSEMYVTPYDRNVIEALTFPDQHSALKMLLCQAIDHEVTFDEFVELIHSCR